jgi:hypothetical protein
MGVEEKPQRAGGSGSGLSRKSSGSGSSKSGAT